MVCNKLLIRAVIKKCTKKYKRYSLVLFISVYCHYFHSMLGHSPKANDIKKETGLFTKIEKDFKYIVIFIPIFIYKRSPPVCLP